MSASQEIYNRLWGGSNAGICLPDPQSSRQRWNGPQRGSIPLGWHTRCGMERKREVIETITNPDRTQTIKMSAEKASFTKRIITGERSGLYMVSLRDFLFYYRYELENYYGESFTPEDDEKWCFDNAEGLGGRFMILVMVDFSDEIICMDKTIKKKMSRAGSQQRMKMKHRYSYENPMNRIHGFICISREMVVPYMGKKVMTISIIASSPFSNKRGVGSDMMDIIKKLARDCEYDDIILEVANEHAGMES